MIYLDHAATTPLDPRVAKAMREAEKLWGNPSSAHQKGREARAAIERARGAMASHFRVKPQEVIFVASGSEGNTLALFGIAAEWLQREGKPGHMVLLSTEHHCSLKAVERLERQGWKITLLPVDETGRLDLDHLKRALEKPVSLVSIQWANNEVGTLQPVDDIRAMCGERGVPFHCDAVQGIGQLVLPSVPLADLVTIAAHKFYGPKGIGALIVSEKTHIEPIILGGGQEFGLRSGTENTPAIVGMAAAFLIAQEKRQAHEERMRDLRGRFLEALRKLPGASLNGHPTLCLPSVINVRFSGRSAEDIVIKLDLQGICASTGAACAAGAVEPSHVLAAMGIPSPALHENVRFSLGRENTVEEIEETVQVLKGITKATSD